MKNKNYFKKTCLILFSLIFSCKDLENNQKTNLKLEKSANLGRTKRGIGDEGGLGEWFFLLGRNFMGATQATLHRVIDSVLGTKTYSDLLREWGVPEIEIQKLEQKARERQETFLIIHSIETLREKRTKRLNLISKIKTKINKIRLVKNSSIIPIVLSEELKLVEKDKEDLDKLITSEEKLWEMITSKANELHLAIINIGPKIMGEVKNVGPEELTQIQEDKESTNQEVVQLKQECQSEINQIEKIKEKLQGLKTTRYEINQLTPQIEQLDKEYLTQIPFRTVLVEEIKSISN